MPAWECTTGLPCLIVSLQLLPHCRFEQKGNIRNNMIYIRYLISRSIWGWKSIAKKKKKKGKNERSDPGGTPRARQESRLDRSMPTVKFKFLWQNRNKTPFLREYHPFSLRHARYLAQVMGLSIIVIVWNGETRSCCRHWTFRKMALLVTPFQGSRVCYDSSTSLGN